MKVQINKDQVVNKAISDMKKCSKDKQEKIKAAIKSSTTAVKNNAKQKAPLGKTGNLKAGIEMEMYKNGEAGIVQAKAKHSHLVELGTNPRFTAPRKKKALKINDRFAKGLIPTGKMKPKPFLRPAADEEYPHLVEKLTDALK